MACVRHPGAPWMLLLCVACILSVHLCTSAAAADPLQLNLGGEFVPTATNSSSGQPGIAGTQPQPQQQTQQQHARKRHHAHMSKGFLQHPDHKALLPIEVKDVALFLLSFMVLCLAAGAGIGGGVLLVPMLSLITGFNSIQTVALSNVAIFAGAVTNMAFNLPRENPFKPGPIIDYDLLLLFGPPIVMGSIAGSYLNYYIPGWVTKVLVLLVLAPMTYRMICKARMLWVAETRRVSCVNNHNNMAKRSLVGTSMDLVLSVPEDQELPPDQLAAALGPNSATAGGAAVDAAKRAQQQLAPIDTAAARHAGPCPFLGSSHATVLSPTAAGHQQQLHEQSSSDAGQLLLSSVQAPTRSHSHTMLSALGETLSDRPPTLADLLGPYFLLLTDDKAADATLQAQALSRAPGSMQLQPSGSVPRRHTLDVFHNSTGGQLGAAPCAKHHSSGTSSSSRPSSAPTVPSEWDCDLATDIRGDSDSAGHCGATAAAAAAAAASRHSHVKDPLSIISPFQLYQQQRYQQHVKAEKGTTGGGEQQQLSAQPSLVKQLPVCAQHKCRKLEHTGCQHSPELEAKMRHVIQHHAVAQVPKTHLAALVLMLATVIVTSVAATLELTCGTWEYWMLVLAPLPVMLVVWALMRVHVLWRVGWGDALDMTHPTDIHWTRSSTLAYPAVVVTVGVMAGMLGLGGGIVLAPLLLEMGVQPAVSAASSQAAMLMSSCTSTVVYLVANAVPADYGIAMALIGFGGTLFGQVATAQLVQRTGRSSILVLILAILFVLATGASLVVVSNSVTAIVHAPSKLTATHATEICSMRGA